MAIGIIDFALKVVTAVVILDTMSWLYYWQGLEDEHKFTGDCVDLLQHWQVKLILTTQDLTMKPINNGILWWWNIFSPKSQTKNWKKGNKNLKIK